MLRLRPSLLVSMTKGEKMDKIEKFSQALKKSRSDLGMTQAEIAKILGFPKRTYENWEEGSRKPTQRMQEMIIDMINDIRRSKKMKIETKYHHSNFEFIGETEGQYKNIVISDFIYSFSPEAGIYETRTEAVEDVASTLLEDLAEEFPGVTAEDVQFAINTLADLVDSDWEYHEKEE